MADFDILAKISADASDFKKGVSEATNAFKDFAKENGISMAGIADGFTNTGKAMTTGITLPVVAGLTAAVKSFADLEQVVGGIEKLFKDSANAVIENSETAYKRAGVSGVDYMEQVTSFSATLLAGLDGDTVKAAEYADKAIVDMADNANTFGTNIGDIQNAYQGFAKDNYTMLDNLKLGFGGTAGEMARLVNESGVMGESFEATAENVKEIPFDQLIEAIHVVQTEMDITGTTSREAAETVSGSFDTMLAAGKNLLAGLGSTNSDVEGLMADLSEAISIFVENVRGVLGTIWDNLPLEDWQKWIGVAVVAAGPILMAIGAVIKAVLGIIQIVKVVGAVLTLLASPVGLVIAAIAALVAIGVLLWQNWDEVKAKAIEIWTSISGWFTATIPPMIEGIIEWFKKIPENLKAIWDNVVTTVSEWVTNMVEKAKEVGSNFVESVKTFFDELPYNIGYALGVAFATVINWVMDMSAKAVEVGENFINNVVTFFSTLPSRVSEWVQKTLFNVSTWASDMWNKAKEMGNNFISGVVEFFSTLPSRVYTWLLETIARLAVWSTNMQNKGKEAANKLVTATVNGLTGLPSKIFQAGKDVVMGFWNGIVGMYDWIKNKVSGFFNGIIDGVKSVLKIGSPSKLFKQFGEWTDEGFIQGIDKGARGVRTSMGNMVGGAINTAESMTGKLNNALAASVSGGYAMTANGQLSIEQQPAYINLDLGGRNFTAFVDDISNTQNMQVQLQTAYL